MLKMCNRCKKLIEYPATYCDECKPIMEEVIAKNKVTRDKRYNQKRDKKYLQFYRSKEWITLREKYMQDKGYKCEMCGKLATEVHHKEPIQTVAGWERRLDYLNLLLVCVKCHNKLHHRFGKEKSNEVKSIDRI